MSTKTYYCELCGRQLVPTVAKYFGYDGDTGEKTNSIMLKCPMLLGFWNQIFRSIWHTRKYLP